MPDFCLPDLGEGLTEAEVVAWHVEVGDHVSVDQPVLEVETAKATVEVPCPYAGVVTAVHAAPGAVVAVGSVLVSVTAATDRLPADPLPADPLPADPLRADPLPADPGSADPGSAPEASGNVLIGYGTSPARTGSDARRQRRAYRASARSSVATPARSASGAAPAVTSPLVRRLARDAHLDLHAINGSGPDGLITRLDVDRAIGSQLRARPAADDGVTRIPLTGIRRVTADKLARSRREIPEATVWVDVDATELLAARAALNAAHPEEPVSITALLARFTTLGLRRYPELNARVDAQEIVLFGSVHLGFAAQTDRGLVVPVVRDADRLSTAQLNRRLRDATAAARAGTLAPAELTGGTFTVNNYGVFGVDGSAAIINHPEVGILGIGRVVDRPWVHQGRIVVRKVSQLTLSFDHRVCDGATAGGFLRYVADCVEAPVTALHDL